MSVPAVNWVKDKLRAGTPVFGTWRIVRSATVAEIGAAAGLDFQILDMEHGPYDLPSLEAEIRACELHRCSPLVRVPDTRPSAVQNVLDLGAHGVVTPQVKDYESALAAAQAARFAPGGIRGFNPFTRAGGFGTGRGSRLDNGFGLTSIIIENKTALADLDRILGIEHLDMLYLGVYDMSVALGCMGKMDHPDLLRFVDSSVPRIRKAGKSAGLMVRDRKDIDTYLKMGVDFFVYRVDSQVIHQAISEGVAAFASATAANKVS